MKEIRRDSITGDLAIYVSFRGKRPRDNHKSVETDNSAVDEISENCPFCVGNEHMTGEAQGVLVEDEKWTARSILNKFPILDMSVKDIFGQHEVIIEGPRHNGTYYNMSEKEFFNIFSLIKDRYEDLSAKEGIKYVNIFKNSEKEAGASLTHPHSQIISLSIIPPEIEKELSVAQSHHDSTGRNLYDDIIFSELEYGKRVIHNGIFFIVYIPYATRYNGEIRIVSKNSYRIPEWSEGQIKELAYIYRNLFRTWKQSQGEIPFNNVIHSYSSDYEKDIYRTHIHIIPRKYNFGGFELSTNLFVCSTDPDELAEDLKFD